MKILIWHILSWYRQAEAILRGVGTLKKLILIVAFIFIFTVPAFAATTMSVEDAMKERSISSQDINMAKDAVGDISKNIFFNISPNSEVSVDYDDAISYLYLKDLDLISAYRKDGNLKTNFTQSMGFNIPVKINGIITDEICLTKAGSTYGPVKKDGVISYEVTSSKSDNTYKIGSGAAVNSDNSDIYDKNKIIQLFHSAGIYTVSDLQYVCTVNYFIRMVYAYTPNGEYAIPYNCDGYGLGVTHGKVYKVPDMINILEKYRNEKSSQVGMDGVNLPNESASTAVSQSAKPIAKKSLKTTLAKLNFVPYVCVISGVVLAGILLLIYFKHKKSKTNPRQMK